VVADVAAWYLIGALFTSQAPNPAPAARVVIIKIH
jgi:hypothetical protein